ncbi:MAG: tetratricopeptide repeat protein [Deltaproteobacteria bacterium]|nr:tetratricopeptide repeat protein [Deltaproteobacteria bacterium]
MKRSFHAMVMAAGLSVVALTGLAGCSGSGDEQSRPVNATGPAVAVQQQSASNVIGDLKARVADKPGDFEAVRSLADAYFELKQFNEAIVYYKKALDLRPGDADIYTELGLCYHYTNNSREAIRYLDEGIAKNPYHQRIWLTKGFVLAYGMGDLEAAKAAWEKANALNPESQIGKAAGDYLAMFKMKKNRK